MFTQKCNGKSQECPWCCRGCGEGSRSSYSVPEVSPQCRGGGRARVPPPGQTKHRCQRWERRAWQREGGSWGNVSLSRMRKPLPLPLSCRVSCQRHGDGSAGTELLCHLSGTAVSGSRGNKPKERLLGDTRELRVALQHQELFKSQTRGSSHQMGVREHPGWGHQSCGGSLGGDGCRTWLILSLCPGLG